MILQWAWSGIPSTPEQAQATADRFIAALDEGERVPPAPAGEEKRRERPESSEDCNAANLHPGTHPPMTGTVLRVIDGDTVAVSVEGTEMRVRLWGIDAPETDQPGGPEARNFLEGMLALGKTTIHPVSVDRYGRVIGVLGEESDWAVNFLMVARGWAYHYREYGAQANLCLWEAEKIAQDHGVGLWRGGSNGGVRPWEHRREKRMGPGA